MDLEGPQAKKVKLDDHCGVIFPRRGTKMFSE